MVNARELHEFLGSKRQFANWIKERIESYEFVENVDYVVFNNFVKNPKGGRISIEWSTQLQKLNRNKEKFGCVHMNIPSKGGNQSTL